MRSAQRAGRPPDGRDCRAPQLRGPDRRGGHYAAVNGLRMYYQTVLPGTTHVTIINRTEWLLSMIGEFLDAPMPKGN